MARLSPGPNFREVGRAQRPAILWGHVERGKTRDARTVSCEKTARIQGKDFLKMQTNVLFMTLSSGFRAQVLLSLRWVSSLSHG